MEKTFGRDIGVLNGATEGVNKTIVELKLKTATEEIKAIEKQLAVKLSTSKRATEYIKSQKKDLSRLEAKLDLYKGCFNNIFALPKGKANLLGDKVRFTKKEATELIETCEAYFSEKIKANYFKDRLKQLSNKYSNLEKSISFQNVEKLQIENFKLKKDITTLKNELNKTDKKYKNLQKAVFSMPDEIIEKINNINIFIFLPE